MVRSALRFTNDIGFSVTAEALTELPNSVAMGCTSVTLLVVVFSKSRRRATEVQSLPKQVIKYALQRHQPWLRPASVGTINGTPHLSRFKVI